MQSLTNLSNLLKNSLNDKDGKPSHKRILVYMSWGVLFIAFVTNTYFKIKIDPGILYLFAGFVGGGMGLSVMEKAKG